MEKKNNSFLFGLIIGLIIASIAAVIIYKNNKSEVFEILKNQLNEYFKNIFPKSPQKPDQKKKTSSIASKPRFKKPKMFVKPKK